MTGWSDILDRCAGCGSTHLAKALGAVSCRDCGREVSPASAAEDFSVSDPRVSRGSGPGQPVAASPSLSDEVEAALARVLGRAVT
ncbi:hypothetical protein [Frankia sp. Cas3]|uniref:hypothetical protein n=1 Tax=Frankia sp. Cas3 TaxID=3073926 RepID=UPI002AD1D757|nr:hypothetical protein [Frankia sp. Cas3]